MATFTGGQKLEAKLAELAVKLRRPGSLKVGFLAKAKYPDGTSVALIAALNDFGTATAPPRPFFRNMIAAKSKEWPAAVGNLLKVNDYDAVEALRITGDAIAGQLRQSIIDTNAPPLAASTIARKGFDKPLIETSHMINSVDFEVKT